ncbi:PadR family transcriptional regulator [Exiguobacterium sp. K1]|mgnify:CR=1 FL=1|uniref:PadR family transcriptional regulator n=1 Tax=Exiguobacterium sp. K1 TaxID=2980105 RepID=UPI00299D851B|nr:PadR family transcriptional regulator [Exiguobacterium sp. K1]MDX1259987.1 PadR family transcriptional regulator [Exiguobacterium sp. K1]
MALRFALLGLLTQGEATGYDLSTTFKKQMTHFWTAHHTQIYRELLKMEEDRLVTSVYIVQEDLPDKKVYSITEEGQTALVAWLRAPSEFKPKMKDENLMRVSLLHLLPPDEAILYLEESKRHHQFAVDMMKIWRKDHLENGATLGETLTSEYGLRMMLNYLDWCDWAMEEIKKSQANV